MTNIHVLVLTVVLASLLVGHVQALDSRFEFIGLPAANTSLTQIQMDGPQSVVHAIGGVNIYTSMQVFYRFKSGVSLTTLPLVNVLLYDAATNRSILIESNFTMNTPCQCYTVDAATLLVKWGAATLVASRTWTLRFQALQVQPTLDERSGLFSLTNSVSRTLPNALPLLNSDVPGTANATLAFPVYRLVSNTTNYGSDDAPPLPGIKRLSIPNNTIRIVDLFEVMMQIGFFALFVMFAF